VQIRRLTAQAIVSKEYHYEMPFEVQADGPYFNLLDFFGRLGRLSRIINVGDLSFDDPDKAKGTKYPVRPGTTVSGIFHGNNILHQSPPTLVWLRQPEPSLQLARLGTLSGMSELCVQ